MAENLTTSLSINGHVYDLGDAEARADVSTLQEQMATAEGNIETLQTNVGGLVTAQGTLQSDVETLQGDVGTLQDSVGELAYRSGTYTPTLMWGTLGTAVSASNLNFGWELSGNVLFVNGRFQLTATPSSNSTINISLPTITGVTYATNRIGYGICGQMFPPTHSGGTPYPVQAGSNMVSVLGDSGGNYIASPPTGYYTVYAHLIINRTA